MKKYTIVVLLTVVLFSCSIFKMHYLNIESYKVSKYNIGLNPNINIIEAKGNLRSLNDEFIDYFIKKSKSSKINVFNKINRGIELKNKNNKPQLTGIESSNDSVKPYFFSFEIVDKSDEIITKQEKEKYKEKVSKGSYIEEVEKERNIDVAYVKTEIIVQLTLANASKFILDQKEYKMSIDWKKQSEPTEKNQRYILVLQKIVEQFLDDVVPKIDSKRTSMDISDENLQPIIDDVKKGDTKNSIEKLKKYILDNPNSAPANYNLALIFDYLKDYSNAMLYYNKACSIDPKYNQIKSECENRIQNLNDINSEH